jgi:type IV secretory pathway VirB4 component
MNPAQSNSPQGSAPANYTGGDYDMGSVNVSGGPQVLPPQQTPTNPNSTQNALQISEIRDGIVIMSDGSFRAVVMCHSINFDLMSPQEREAVEFSYQGFLNSLYFPVQIFIRSQKVDMRPYLEKMDKIRKEQDNMLLGLLMEDYIAFLADIAQQTNIMDKKFYLVIKFPDTEQDMRKALKQSAGFFTGLAELLSPGKAPHVVINESTLENAKTELRNRVQAVMQGLAQCGIQSLPLDTEELIELYYDAYNPDTATRQQIKDFKNLTAPIITKGEGDADQPQLDRETS